MWDSIINLKDYTITEHIFFASGCVAWVIIYVNVIRNIRSIKYIEIPIMAVCANISWEFIWSFIFETNMGSLYVWGYRLWFILDCYILYGLLMYGSKQLINDVFKKHFHWIVAALIAAWSFMLYYYIKIYDYPISHMGAFSGYIINFMMSMLFITLYVRTANKTLFSVTNNWLKFIGNLFISIFCFLKFDDWFLFSVIIVNTLLDIIYLFVQLRPQKTLEQSHP
ncbi:MAG: hypothetical protein SH856_02890 [Flavobacteriales bacterium]|nr:hypothetical protein [Flavobacteriales bacterium]